MGKLTNMAFSRLDVIIEEQGADWLRSQIVTRVADGADPKAIAASLGVHWIAVRRWIEENCADDIALAGRARADCLEYEATKAVDDADPDNLGVAKLHSDYKLKLAGKLDKKKYGEKVDNMSLAIQVNTNIISADISPHEAAMAYAAMVGKQNG